jgi:hypothetical protein
MHAHIERARGIFSSRQRTFDFDDLEILQQSLNFPEAAVYRELAWTSPRELLALLPPQHGQGSALLVRPIPAELAGTGQSSAAIACWRFQVSQSPRDPDATVLDVTCVAFDLPDWKRHAAAIIPNLAILLAPEHMLWQQHRPLSSKPALDLLPIPGEANSSSSATMREMMAFGTRAIVGRNDFAEQVGFLRACSDLLTTPPSALQGQVSFAAGFSKAIPGALIQWIDAEIEPQHMRASCGRSPRVNAVCSVVDVDRHIDSDLARRSMRESLAMAFNAELREPSDPSYGWRMMASRATCMAESASGALARHALSMVERLFASRTDSLDILRPLSRSPAGRHLLALRAGHALPIASPVEMDDAVDAVEETLATAKWLSGQFTWTPALAALSKAAIAALRQVVINCSASDVSVNATLLRKLSRAALCRQVVGTLIKANDCAVVRGIEQACEATAELTPALDVIRCKLAHDIFVALPQPMIRFGHANGFGSLRLSLPDSHARQQAPASGQHAQRSARRAPNPTT